MKKMYLFSVLSLMLLFFSGCSASVLMGDENIVYFCEEAVDGTGCEGRDQTSFSPNTAAINASMYYQGGRTGDLFRSEWAYEQGGKFAEYTIDLQKDHNPLLIFTVTEPDKGWPVGDYEFRLYKNDSDNPVATRRFTVE